MSEKVMVELVLDRPHHEDLLYGTGVSWPGKGSVRAIPAEAWAKFAKHPDVYRRVEVPATPLASIRPAPSPASPAVHAETAIAEAAGKGIDMVVVAPRPQWTPEVLAGMTDAEIHESGKRLDLRLHPRYAGENLRKAFLDAVATVPDTTKEPA